MPVKIEQLPPKKYDGRCPTCNYPVTSYFDKSESEARGYCDWCSDWLTVELKGGTLTITDKDSSAKPIRRIEKCPNPDCQVEWELWFNPNGALAKPHGAQHESTGNRVRCLSCKAYATVSI